MPNLEEVVEAIRRLTPEERREALIALMEPEDRRGDDDILEEISRLPKNVSWGPTLDCGR